jgi:hypothetical protein
LGGEIFRECALVVTLKKNLEGALVVTQTKKVTRVLERIFRLSCTPRLHDELRARSRRCQTACQRGISEFFGFFASPIHHAHKRPEKNSRSSPSSFMRGEYS